MSICSMIAFHVCFLNLPKPWLISQSIGTSTSRSDRLPVLIQRCSQSEQGTPALPELWNKGRDETARTKGKGYDKNDESTLWWVQVFYPLKSDKLYAFTPLLEGDTDIHPWLGLLHHQGNRGNQVDDSAIMENFQAPRSLSCCFLIRTSAVPSGSSA